MLGMKIAIDFGSSTITVFAEDRGIILCEPSVMILDSYTNEPVAMGKKAAGMLGKLPESMKVIYPICDGVITDYNNACLMLRSYLDRICSTRLLRPNVLMCVAGSVTELEKKVIFDAIMSSGAARACFIDEALASAIGVGISLTEAKGCFVCDIGGGTTDCAVVTMGNIAVSGSLKFGGRNISDGIMEYILREYGMIVGLKQAEEIKAAAGSAVLRTDEVAITVCGKNRDSGMPQLIEITSTELYWVIKNSVDEIVDCIRGVLEITPPELSADIADNGIILTGGSSLLFGLDNCIEWATGVKVRTVAEPDKCAAAGMGRLLKNLSYLEKNGYYFESADKDVKDED